MDLKKLLNDKEKMKKILKFRNHFLKTSKNFIQVCELLQ
jgi:hypothetical protein